MKKSCWDQTEKLVEPSTNVHGVPSSVWHGELTGLVSLGYGLRGEPPPHAPSFQSRLGLARIGRSEADGEDLYASHW